MQRVCEFFHVEPHYFWESESITNNVENNYGVVYNKGVFNSFPEDLIKTLSQNQQQISQQQSQISQLMEAQNKLIKKLLGN